MGVGIFFLHQAELVLRHQMQVSNYFVKYFYSVPWITTCQFNSKNAKILVEKNRSDQKIINHPLTAILW